jgi:hypothetical protein
MSDVIFMLRNPDPPAKDRCAVGSPPLEQAWLDALVRRVAEGLDRDQLWFMVAILWAPPPGQPRSPDDACSRLQNLGFVMPSKSRSICVPTKLTPLGHSVRECIFNKVRSIP